MATCNLVFAQTKSFDQLLDLYQRGDGINIDSSTAIEYFDFTPKAHTRQLRTGKILLQTKNFIALTAKSLCGAGGYCESSSISTFTYGGELIDRAPFESVYFLPSQSHSIEDSELLDDTSKI